MTRRKRISGGLSGILFAVGAVGATLGVVLAGPTAAVTCAPIFVSASGTPNTPSKLLEFASGATGNVAPANTIGGPMAQLVTASGIAQDAAGFTYVASPNPKKVNVYSPGASGDVAPFAVLSGANPGLNSPQGIVVQNGLLYVANGPFPTGSPSIAVFTLPLAAGVNNVAPVAVIAGPATGLISPFGLAVDSAGNIFVANLNNTVTEYAPPPPSSYASPNNAAPILTITTASPPEGLAIQGNILYVSNDNNTITEFSLPSGTLLNTISGPNTGLASPLGIDVDSLGNIFVVNSGSRVLEFAAGATGDTAPIANISGPAAMLISPQFVYIAACSGGTTTTTSSSTTTTSSSTTTTTRPSTTTTTIPATTTTTRPSTTTTSSSTTTTRPSTTTTSTTPSGPTCLGHRATIVGTEGNDRIFGTDGPDVIVGLGGDDQIYGFGGDDIICGGDGTDVVDGGAGNDILDGQAGDDRVIGGLGNDDVRGGPGSDRVFANNGDDKLDGGPDAPDYCYKGTGSTTFANCEVYPAGT